MSRSTLTWSIHLMQCLRSSFYLECNCPFITVCITCSDTFTFDSKICYKVLKFLDTFSVIK